MKLRDILIVVLILGISSAIGAVVAGFFFAFGESIEINQVANNWVATIMGVFVTASLLWFSRDKDAKAAQVKAR